MDLMINAIAVVVFSWAFISYMITDRIIRRDPVYDRSWPIWHQRANNAVVLSGFIGFGIWMAITFINVNGLPMTARAIFYVSVCAVFLAVSFIFSLMLKRRAVLDYWHKRQFALDRVSLVFVFVVIFWCLTFGATR